MTEEEKEKAYNFLQELDKNGYRYTADGREMYIVENVFNKIEKLQSNIEIKDKVIDYLAEKLEEKSKSMTKGKWKIVAYNQVKKKMIKIMQIYL